MFYTVLLSIISTIIIAAIISLILSFVSSFKSDEQKVSQEFLSNVQNEEPLLNQNQFEKQLKPKVQEENLSPNNELLHSEPDIQEKPVLNENLLKHFKSEQHSEPDIQEKPVLNENLLIQFGDEEEFEELSPVKDENEENEETVENIPKETFYTEIIEESIHSNELNDENETEIPVEEENNLLSDLLEIADSQNLTHFNKSRPKKPKSRPSVKVVFSRESNQISENLSENFFTQKASKTTETLYESNVSEVHQNKYSNKTRVENTFESITTSELSFQDECFEEISTGDYKKFDEFSDYFSLETKRQEFIKKCEKNKNKSDLNTAEEGEEGEEGEDGEDGEDGEEGEDDKHLNQTNDQIVDELFANFLEESKGEFKEIEETISITQSETLEITKEDTIQLSVDDCEKSSHNEKVNKFKLSLNKVFSTSEKNLSPSKSPLSATLESVTKPLLNSPTLSRKSQSSLQFEDIDEQEKSTDQEEVSKRIKRISLPVFGMSQTLLLDELKEKQFQKSLKSQNLSSNSFQGLCDKNEEN